MNYTVTEQRNPTHDFDNATRRVTEIRLQSPGFYRLVLLSLPILGSLAGCSPEPEAQEFGRGFPEPARRLTFVAGGRCGLDVVSGSPIQRGWRTDTAKAIWLSGWALEDPAKPASEWVVVELAAPGDRARYFAVSGVRKPYAQLAATIGDGPGLRNAAFELVARGEALPRGRYAIRLLIKGETGGLICDTGRVLELY